MADNNASKSYEPIFVDINPDGAPAEIESLCMNCEKQGITRLLLTKIPHFREIILMAFDCPHCGYRNSEVQSGGTIQEHGVNATCAIDTKKDLNRQVIKGEYASVRINELDLEIPHTTQRGVLTTVEGLLTRTAENLEADQPVRKTLDENLYKQIQNVIDRLQMLTSDVEQNPFTITLDDPAGNSYIENYFAPSPDPKLRVKTYVRSKEQDEALGIQPATNEEVDKEEVLSFPSNCSHCGVPCETNMKVIDIPYFKEVVIMATTCDNCGYKSNEVKAGGPVAEKGKRITLKLTDAEDLSRDILKSETCGLNIPEIDLELTPGTLGGRFTTVEGLLEQVHEELEQRNPFIKGDSADAEKRARWETFLGNLRKVLNMEMKPVTLILDDPLSNSYLQNPYAPEEDPNMKIEFYERSWEQNENLGLNDMKLEGYQAE